MGAQDAMVAALADALEMARDIIAEERDHMLHSACSVVGGKPIRATMDSGMRPHIQRLDRALRKIDKALA